MLNQPQLPHYHPGAGGTVGAAAPVWWLPPPLLRSVAVACTLLAIQGRKADSPTFFKRTFTVARIDGIDLRLLSLLQEHGRTSQQELAHAVGLSGARGGRPAPQAGGVAASSATSAWCWTPRSWGAT